MATQIPVEFREALLQRGFDCITFLGKGAFGVVVKACTKNGKKSAIKILPYKYGDVTMKYQQQELELLTKLELSDNSKRNVIKYFESWILQVGDTQRLYLCIQMELCFRDLQTFVYDNEMGGLKIILAEGQPRFYQHVFCQILNGLVAIHSIGWIHRDIHPGNILIANPNPKRICDIVIKIADFGLAKHIGSIQIEFELNGTRTIVPKLEKLTVSALSKNGLFRAPELSTETYGFKVDVYSAGMVLYFISRYLEGESKMKSELEELKKGELDINACLCDKDDEKLCNLIENLVQEDPKKRPSACDAKEYMYPPTQSKDATDGGATEFFARKDGETALSPCTLKDLTLFKMREEVESHTGIQADRQVLQQERMLNGEKRRIKLDSDRQVENAFRRAAKNKRYVEVVVSEKPHEDRDTEMMEVD